MALNQADYVMLADFLYENRMQRVDSILEPLAEFFSSVDPGIFNESMKRKYLMRVHKKDDEETSPVNPMGEKNSRLTNIAKRVIKETP